MAIDPGVKGGYAVRYPDGSVESGKNPLTPRDRKCLFTHITYVSCKSPGTDRVCYLEKSWGWKSQGSRSAHTSGRNYGQWEQCLSDHGFAFREEPASGWMKCLSGKLPKEYRDRKNELKRRAQNLYPDIHITLDNADALMLLDVACKKEL
jgi:hypothetical protein